MLTVNPQIPWGCFANYSEDKIAGNYWRGWGELRKLIITNFFDSLWIQTWMLLQDATLKSFLRDLMFQELWFYQKSFCLGIWRKNERMIFLIPCGFKLECYYKLLPLKASLGLWCSRNCDFTRKVFEQTRDRMFWTHTRISKISNANLLKIKF